MHSILKDLVQDVHLSGELTQDITAFLIHHGFPKTAAHCRLVAAKADELAARFGVDAAAAEQAGWLHDVSAVFPVDERVEAAEALGLDVLPEERAVPLIIHQKLSAVMGWELFGVTDAAVLSAVGCHTTLKAGASRLDKVVFLADKLAWDRKGQPPFTAAVSAALESSLDAAALAYQQYMVDSGKMKVVHPWMRASYQELTNSLQNP